eukprot:295413-Chlamydomonas_euryale.AAC.2
MNGGNAPEQAAYKRATEHAQEGVRKRTNVRRRASGVLAYKRAQGRATGQGSVQQGKGACNRARGRATGQGSVQQGKGACNRARE